MLNIWSSLDKNFYLQAYAISNEKLRLKQSSKRDVHGWDIFMLTSNAILPWPLTNWLICWTDNIKAVRHKQELWGRNKKALLIIIQPLLWSQDFLSLPNDRGSLKAMLLYKERRITSISFNISEALGGPTAYFCKILCLWNLHVYKISKRTYSWFLNILY